MEIIKENQSNFPNNVHFNQILLQGSDKQSKISTQNEKISFGQKYDIAERETLSSNSSNQFICLNQDIKSCNFQNNPHIIIQQQLNNVNVNLTNLNSQNCRNQFNYNLHITNIGMNCQILDTLYETKKALEQAYVAQEQLSKTQLYYKMLQVVQNLRQLKNPMNIQIDQYTKANLCQNLCQPKVNTVYKQLVEYMNTKIGKKFLISSDIKILFIVMCQEKIQFLTSQCQSCFLRQIHHQDKINYLNQPFERKQKKKKQPQKQEKLQKQEKRGCSWWFKGCLESIYNTITGGISQDDEQIKEEKKKKKKKNHVGPLEMVEEECSPNINLRKSNLKMKSQDKQSPRLNRSRQEQSQIDLNQVKTKEVTFTRKK